MSTLWMLQPAVLGAQAHGATTVCFCHSPTRRQHEGVPGQMHCKAHMTVHALLAPHALGQSHHHRVLMPQSHREEA